MREPVLLHARGIRDEAVGEVLRRGANHRHRRAQLVRDRGDELHLLARESLGALGGDGEHRDAGEHQQQHTEAEREVAESSRRDRGLERAGAVPRHERPSRDVLERLRLAVGVEHGPPIHADEETAALVGLRGHARAERFGGQARQRELVWADAEEVRRRILVRRERVEVIDVQLVDRLRRIGAIDDRDPVLVAGFETEVPVHQGGDELLLDELHVQPDERCSRRALRTA